MIEHWLTIVSCLVILLGATLLWGSSRYEEGVLGHLGLVLMMFSCFVVVGEMWVAGTEYQLLPETLILHVGVALLVTHLCVRHVCWRIWGRRQEEAPQGKLAKLCRHF